MFPSHDRGGRCKIGTKKPSISLLFKGRTSPNLKKGKKILQYSLDGEFISEWDNINHAINKLNLKVTNESIRQSLKGKSNKSGGFIWKYFTEDYPLNLSKNEVDKANNPTYGPLGQKLSEERSKKISKALKGVKRGKNLKISKSVCQYSMDGELLNIYDSVTEAANAVGADGSNITACCRGKKKHVKKYNWEYNHV